MLADKVAVARPEQLTTLILVALQMVDDTVSKTHSLGTPWEPPYLLEGFLAECLFVAAKHGKTAPCDEALGNSQSVISLWLALTGYLNHSMRGAEVPDNKARLIKLMQLFSRRMATASTEQILEAGRARTLLEAWQRWNKSLKQWLVEESLDITEGLQEADQQWNKDANPQTWVENNITASRDIFEMLRQFAASQSGPYVLDVGAIEAFISIEKLSALVEERAQSGESNALSEGYPEELDALACAVQQKRDAAATQRYLSSTKTRHTAKCPYIDIEKCRPCSAHEGKACGKCGGV